MDSELDQFSETTGGGEKPDSQRALFDAADWLRIGLKDSKKADLGETVLESAKTAGNDDLIGEILEDRFVVHSLIGEGGFGEVYLAEQEEPVTRRVAIKVLKAGQFGREIVSRFEGERQALALMSHPNIAKVFDAGTSASGRPFFAMEFVQGEPLTTFCDNRGLGLEERLNLFRQVCDAVQHAHQKGVIHRDLKPSNVLVEDFESGATPRVIDFGIAKATTEEAGSNLVMTRTESLMGTPAYMSPEQAELGAAAVDTRSDVYSLGVILNELLTGALPLDLAGLSNHQALQRVISREPFPPSRQVREVDPEKSERLAVSWGGVSQRKIAARLRGDLDHIVLRSLAKDRELRYPSPKDLSDDLERFMEDRPVRARSINYGYYLLKLLKRRKQLAFGLASLFALAMTGIAATILQGQERERQIGAMLAKGNLALERNDLFGALSPYVQAMALEYSGPEEERTHRYRIGAIQDNLPTVTDMWFCRSRVHCLSYHPSGDKIAAGCEDGTVRVLRNGDPKPLHELRLLDGIVFDVEFSSDGRYLAAVESSGLVAVWDLDELNSRTTLTVPMAPFSVAFLNGDRSLMVGAKTNTVYYWGDWHEKGTPSAFEFPGDGERPVHSLAPLLTESGEKVLCSSLTGPLYLWDVGSQSVEQVFPETENAWKFRVDAHEGPTNLGVTGINNRCTVFDIGSGKILREFLTQGTVRAVAIDHSGQLVASGGDDRSARVWNLATGEPLCPLLRHEGEVTAVCFDPLENALVSSSDSGVLRRWDLSTVHWFPEFPNGRLTTDRGYLYEFSIPSVNVTGGEGRLEYQSSGEGILTAIKHEKKRTFSLRGLVRSLYVNRDGKRIIGVSSDELPADQAQDGKLHIDSFSQPIDWQISIQDLNRDRFEVTATYGLNKGEELLACNAEGNVLLIGQRIEGLSAVKIVDCRDNPIPGRQMLLNSKARQALFVDGSSKVLIVDGQTVIIWNYRSGESQTIQAENPSWRSSFAVSYVGLSYDQRFMVICTGDGGFTDSYARVWSFEDGEFVSPPLMHRDGVNHAAFSPDGKLLATAGEDDSAKVWQFSDRSTKLIREYAHDSDVHRVRFSPDSKWLVTATGDGARLWDVGRGGVLVPDMSRLWGIDRQITDARFLGVGGPVLVERGRGDIAVVALTPSQASLKSLQLLAELWSCTRVGDDNQVFSLRAEDIAERWATYWNLVDPSNTSDTTRQNSFPTD